MRNYQLVLVLKNSLPEPQRKKLLETIKSWLKDVKIVKEEEWGQKPLAYVIKHETAGFYHNFLVEAASLSNDLDKRLTGLEGVLRHLIIKKD